MTQLAEGEGSLPQPLGAGKALGSIAILLTAQFLTGVAVVIVWMTYAILRGDKLADPTFAARMTVQANPALLLGSGLVSLLVVLGLTRLWAWDLVRDPQRRADLGLTGASLRSILLWAVLGVAFGCVYLGAASGFAPQDPSRTFGPVTTAVATGGATRFAWAILALVYAPFVEEYFFRGLLLRGFTASWGPTVAGLVVTFVFLLLHLTETVHFWPATVAVLGLGILALLARRTTRSLAPAMAVHGAYNLVLVVSVFTGFPPA